MQERGERDLRRLMVNMQPELRDEEYVFCSLDEATATTMLCDALCFFRESEGSSMVVPRGAAEAAGIRFAFACRQITLKVHSSLEAVGFLAKVTCRLAEAGISVNPVSAFYHDHLFVPSERAAEAIRILSALRAES